MEDLAWHYPAEPVERAAVRFCEAVAKWRGKPELETVSVVRRDEGLMSHVCNLVQEEIQGSCHASHDNRVTRPF